MDCKSPQVDESSKIDIDNKNYKHYEFMLQMALSKGDPIVLEWIKDAWREVKE